MPSPRLLVVTLVLALTPLAPVRADLVSVPDAPQPVPVVLDGAHAVVRWRNVGPTVTRVIVRRLTGTVAPASPLDGLPVFDGAPAAAGVLQLATDNVSVGHTYTYGFWSLDSYGSLSLAATHSILATAPPVLTAPAVVSDAGPVRTFGLSWGNPANPVGTPYTVKYATPTGWVIWLLDTASTDAVFGAGAGPFVPRLGATYRFEVLSQDPYGNDTRHALATVVEPYDTRSAVPSKGWGTVASTRRWAGTVAVASRPGAALTFHVVAGRVTLIADRCPGCGRARIIVDGVLRLVVDTHADALSVRQQVGTVAHLPLGRHSVVVQVVGSTGHPAVHVDGLAALS